MSEGGMAEMKDKYFLFIVKKIPRSECSGRERFEVVRVTNNEETIRSYHAIGNNYTPLKVCCPLFDFFFFLNFAYASMRSVCFFEVYVMFYEC
jgi:hypothetical protein